MPRIPDSPEEIFEKFTADVNAAYGKELVAIYLFGSGAKGEYAAKKSDINFLIILTQKGIGELDRALEFVGKWRKVNVAVPLFLTKEYINSALDTFPVEFLDIKNFNKLVYGEDFLSELAINKNHMRHQVERELRGKLIHLRTGFLSEGNDRNRMQELLAASVSTFSSIFEGLLFLKNEALPSSKIKVFEKTADIFKLDKNVFVQLINIKNQEWRGSAVQLQEITLSYINEIKKLVETVDKM